MTAKGGPELSLRDEQPTSFGLRQTNLQIVSCIEADAGHQFEFEKLRVCLDALFEAAGLSENPSEEQILWREYTEDQLRHSAFVKHFERLAGAPDPIEASRSNSQVRALLGARLRARWASTRVRRDVFGEFSLSKLVWEKLSATEQEEIRDHCRDLAHYFRSHIRPGARQKSMLDTLVLELAEIWGRFTGGPGDIRVLPHSQNSRFVQFLSFAMESRAHGTETSRSALSARWRRLKLANQQEVPESGDPDEGDGE